VLALAFAALLVGPQACSTKNQLVGAGQACFLATDCEPGLVCVPQENGGRLCSDDLTRVAGDTPPEAGPADAATPDAPQNDAPSDSPPNDTGPQDTGADTGEQDTGAG
jgi:hypothetical protein